MAKLLHFSLLATVLGVAMPAFAEDVELFSFTVDETAVEKNILIKVSSEGGQKINVDWGNGALTSYDIVDYNADGWVFSEVKGTLAGTTVTVYGTDASKINYLDLDKDNDDDPEVQITSVNVANLTGVTELNVSKNRIAGIDISKCGALATFNATDNVLAYVIFDANNAALKSINVSNNYNMNTGEKNDGAGDNQVLGSSWGLLPNLATLNVTGNLASRIEGSGAFDISECANLSTLTINACGIDEYDFSSLKKLKTLNAQWNGFTTIDLSNMVAKSGIAFLAHNNLKSVKLPDTSASKMTRVNLADNALDFTTLPAAGMTSNANNYVYFPQKDMVVEADGNVVDLSSQAMVDDTATVYAWKLGDADATDGFTAENGVFTFSKSGEYVCSMTNALFPKLTLTTVPITVDATSGVAELEGEDADAPVEYFNLQGVKVSGDAPGIYVRRQGKTVSKVIVK